MTVTFLDNVRFNPTAGGTTDWIFSTAVTGYQSPSLGGVANGQTLKYFAVSADLSQWEIGGGTYNTSTGVLSRTTVYYNSSGTGTATGQSGAGTKINFTNPPQVAVVAMGEDLLPWIVGQIPGIATNTAASAGNVGETIVSSGTSGSLSSGTATQIASITLTPGDWDISAEVEFNASGGTSVTDWYSCISTTTATVASPIANSLTMHERIGSTADHANAHTHSPVQTLVSTNTTYFLNVEGVYTGTAPTATFSLRARRPR